jgi:hypothetical protein
MHCIRLCFAQLLCRCDAVVPLERRRSLSSAFFGVQHWRSKQNNTPRLTTALFILSLQSYVFKNRL